MADSARHQAGESLPAARVIWDNAQCLSADHGDRYYSPDAIQEVNRVFIEPVGLIERLQRLPSNGPITFTCGELGFGSGLNAATLIETFLVHAPDSARLHFISFERAPFSAADMQRMAARFGAHLPIYSELCEAYPPRLTGWHRLHLAAKHHSTRRLGGRVTLSLFWGDAQHGLADIENRQRLPVDHWLLDGFAPKKNPSLWQPALFQKIAYLSAQTTTVATYSAVGEVRRALQSVGFAMRRVDQMPIKLHSLAGELSSREHAGTRHASTPPFTHSGSIQVIGAGIAGTSVARGLAERGIAVKLIEPSGRIASQASRIPAAVLHGRLRDDGTADAAWQAMSYHYSHRRMQAFPGFKVTGARQISGPNTDPEKLAALLDRYGGSGDWLQPVSSPGTRFRDAQAALRFSIGGVVHGPTLCRHLASHPLISLSASPAAVVKNEDTEAGAGVTVLANAGMSRLTPAAGYLELASLAGQAELCSHNAPPTEPIVGAGYMAPCKGGMVIGSTYEYRPWSSNEAVAANLAPWLDTGQHRGSFRGYRTITSDRVCIVGKLFSRELEAVNHLRIATGFGSTGMSSAPFAGECIAAELAGEFAPITQDLQTAVSSERFRHRQARRGPRMDADPS